MDYLPLRLGRRLSSKRRPASEHFIQQGTEGIDVRGRPDCSRFTAHLLGGHITGSSQPDAAQRQRRPVIKVPRQPKIGDFGRPRSGKQYIARLEIAMHDPSLVRQLHGLGQREEEHGRLASRLRRARKGLRQAAAFEELHRKKREPFGVTHIVDLNDVRVVQARHRLRFALKRARSSARAYAPARSILRATRRFNRNCLAL